MITRDLAVDTSRTRVLDITDEIGGRMRLGTWQRVVVVDLNADNPRRTVRLSLLQG